MKLRSRLFLSSSALMTLALLGLLLGMTSVLLLTRAQNQAMTRNLEIIEASLGLRQEMGSQVILLLRDHLDRQALKASDQRFRQWLQRAGAGAIEPSDQQALAEIERAYEQFDQFLDSPVTVRRQLLEDDRFVLALQALRDRINAVQTRYVGAVELDQEQSRQRAWMIAALLGLISLALLVIGFITAHAVAQRFGRPIEALAAAADQIGRGDFQVTLPLSGEAELASLTQRFGQMAEALRQFRASRVAELIASQRRLQAVLDSIDDGLLIIDRNGCLEHGNPVAQRQFGWDDTPTGQPLPQLLAHEPLREQLQLALAGEHPEQDGEDLSLELGGEQRLLSYSLTPVSDESGGVLGAVMVLRDVTAQRAFERVRGEFVLRASHELRTPVTGMHMAFGLLRERLHFAAESREDDLLRTVDEEMQRLLRLLNDLLDFSRYQNGLQQLELQPCAPQELLEQAARRFSAKAAEQDIELLLETQEPLPHLRADRLQLERVLDNLLGNALRHTPGGGQIRLQARRQGEQLILGVEDSGEGIAYGQQARVFEPFVQVGRRKGGAGLGLALCKEIVQLHGGRIGLHSRPGQGASFYLALPL
ncbi:KinB sensor domain-containing domain [Pseudomonas sp. BMS12]|uniref:KinB sensor domain-containing domain n=1 Tax=Pseudomonas sp. BMS12 TaxID=1796033 RepID=UPI00083B7659|nr:KinB sensor domain-containing domain [Pseudomonas sp. BMS12]